MTRVNEDFYGKSKRMEPSKLIEILLEFYKIKVFDLDIRYIRSRHKIYDNPLTKPWPSGLRPKPRLLPK